MALRDFVKNVMATLVCTWWGITRTTAGATIFNWRGGGGWHGADTGVWFGLVWQAPGPWLCPSLGRKAYRMGRGLLQRIDAGSIHLGHPYGQPLGSSTVDKAFFA